MATQPLLLPTHAYYLLTADSSSRAEELSRGVLQWDSCSQDTCAQEKAKNASRNVLAAFVSLAHTGVLWKRE